jgi:hypothetical protein
MGKTIRDGVSYEIDLGGTPGITVIGGKYSRRELDYLPARLEGADLLRDLPVVCAHRIGHLTIRVDAKRVAPYRPSAQSLADYVAGALR